MSTEQIIVTADGLGPTTDANFYAEGVEALNLDLADPKEQPTEVKPTKKQNKHQLPPQARDGNWQSYGA